MDSIATTARLAALARQIASTTLDFQAVKGPGVGDHGTAAFMRALGVDPSRAGIWRSSGFLVVNQHLLNLGNGALKQSESCGKTAQRLL